MNRRKTYITDPGHASLKNQREKRDQLKEKKYQAQQKKNMAPESKGGAHE